MRYILIILLCLFTADAMAQSGLVKPKKKGRRATSVEAPDVTPPAAPSIFVAAQGDGEVVLDITTAGDAFWLTIWRSEVTPVDTTAAGAPDNAVRVYFGVDKSSHTDGTVVNGTTYYYIAWSEDEAGNQSAASSEAPASPQAAGPGPDAFTPVTLSGCGPNGSAVLPQNYEDFECFYDWMETLTADSLTISHAGFSYVSGSQSDSLEYEMYARTDDKQRYSENPTAKNLSVYLPAASMLLSGIEVGGQVYHPRFGSTAAFMFESSFHDGTAERNPWYNDPEVCRRAMIGDAVDMMMQQQQFDNGITTYDRSDMIGGQLYAWAYTFEVCWDEAMGTAVSKTAYLRMMERFLDRIRSKGPQRITPNMDSRTLEAMARIYRSTDDTSIRDKAQRTARRIIFGCETGCDHTNPINSGITKPGIYFVPGYVGENVGHDAGYNGTSAYHVAAACAIGKGLHDTFDDICTALSQMWDFKLHQTYLIPNTDNGFPTWEGPSSQSSRTSTDHLGDFNDSRWRKITDGINYRIETGKLNLSYCLNDGYSTTVDRTSTLGRSAANRQTPGIKATLDSWNTSGLMNTSSTTGYAPWVHDHDLHWPPAAYFSPVLMGWDDWYTACTDSVATTFTNGTVPDDYYNKALPPGLVDTTYTKFFGDEFYTRRDSTTAGRQFQYMLEHIGRDWEYAGWGGGSVMFFSTETTGPIIRGQHEKSGSITMNDIHQWVADHLVLKRNSDGLYFSSAWYHLTDTTPDPRTDTNLVANGYIEHVTGLQADNATQPGVYIDSSNVKMTTRFYNQTDGLRLWKGFVSDGSVSVDSAWYSLPVRLRNCNDANVRTFPGGQCTISKTTIEYWTGSAWATLSTTAQTTDAIRFGQHGANLYLDLNGNESVRLSTAEWEDPYNTDLTGRGLWFMLYAGGGTPAAMPSDTLQIDITVTDPHP